jgi:hypothetical protein
MSDDVVRRGPNQWFESAKQSLEEKPAEPPAPKQTVAGGGGPPHDPGMETRLAAVETRMDRIEVKLDALETRLRGVEVKLGEIGGKLDLLVGKIPSWWQAPVSAAGLLALLFAAVGLAQHFGLIVTK